MQFIILCCALFLYATIGQKNLISAQAPPRPTFPDTFQVELEGIFKEEEAELDAIIYYDKPKNRAAIFTDYQNVRTKKFFFFDSKEVVTIEGFDCSVDSLPTDSGSSFFPFVIDERSQNVTLAPPEEMLHFSKSEYKAEELVILPSFIYEAKLDFPQYEVTNCDVTHIFSKPEIQTPTCDDHFCQSILLAISVQCPGESEDEMPALDHVYNFYRFRSGISDETVFQSPPGIYCARKNTKAFQDLPNYFSFSYDITERQRNAESIGGIHILHKKVWYDANLKIMRVDEFDDNGLLTTTKVFDYYGGAAYTILTQVLQCSGSPLTDDLALDEITKLPGVIFPQNKSNSNDEAVYVGKRTLHGLDYDVWSLQSKSEEDEFQIVKDIYFAKNVPNKQLIVNEFELQLSHAEFYTYEKDDETHNFDLSMTTYVSINNFRSKPREWTAFDVASCFTENQKKAFLIKVKGPSIVKGSTVYKEIMETLYLKLITAAGISVIRLSELIGMPDIQKFSVFKGWILENPILLDIGKKNSEPDMNAAYEKIEAEIRTGKIVFTVPHDDKNIEFKVETIEPVVEAKHEPSGYTGVSLAVSTLLMLILGMLFGAVGYYVFLKRRKPAGTSLLISS